MPPSPIPHPHPREQSEPPMSTTVILLAAGQGTRMRSALPKVLHPVNGRPMVDFVVAAVAALDPERLVAVVGHQGERVADHLATSAPGAVVVEQVPQRGTGDAVAHGLTAVEGERGCVVVVSGDCPLVRGAELARLVAHHERCGAAVSLFTAEVAEPGGLGRIVRDGSGRFARIVEAKDASEAELAIREINTGLYCFDLAFLRAALPKLSSDNAQGELYLTDVVEMAVAEGRPVEGLAYPVAAEVMGVNSRMDLAAAAAHARARVNQALMASGVSLIDPAATYVEAGVTVGQDTVLHPGVCLHGATRIGAGCEIGPCSVYIDAELGDGVVDRGHSHLEGCVVAEAAQLGPFARLRPGAQVGREARVGNFVEIKRSTIGEGSKVSHLSYIGDTVMGAGVNVGAGTITCNYDGANKHQTVIGDDVFIGSDTQLVAPVEVGAGALIGAGTTVTGDVPPGALTTSRAPQEDREGAGARYLARVKEEKAKRSRE